MQTAQPFAIRTADAEPVRFTVVRSAGSLFNVFDQQRQAVVAHGRRFTREAGQVFADELNADYRELGRLAGNLPAPAPLPPLGSALLARRAIFGAHEG